MSGETILIEQLRADVERLELDLAAVAMCDSSDCGLCVSCLVSRAEKSERERDAAVAAIAASERRAAEADVHLSDAESRRRTAGSNAIEWESRAKNAERALAAAGESADAIRAMLGGADDLVIAVRCLADRAEKAEEERDALRHHYDKAGPEHNLLALLDMYDEWRAAAESERDEERHLADVRGEMLTKTERERDEARAERDALHVALELAEVDVALDRSWCRICRTECRGAHRGRREHMHATECVLNIRAHAKKERPVCTCTRGLGDYCPTPDPDCKAHAQKEVKP